MSLGTTDTFALKNTSGATRILRFFASYDGDCGNNRVLGLKLALNGTPIDASECRAATGSSASFAKLVTSLIIPVDPDDEVALFVANFSGTQNIDLNRGRILATSVD
jgi:hypothetical protein